MYTRTNNYSKTIDAFPISAPADGEILSFYRLPFLKNLADFMITPQSIDICQHKMSLADAGTFSNEKKKRSSRALYVLHNERGLLVADISVANFPDPLN